MTPLKNTIYISSTLLKSLEDGFGNEKVYCPRQLYETRITDRIATLRSESMAKGLYFETHTLGGGRYGHRLEELTKTKKGEKTTDNKRIDGQIFNFKEKVKANNLIVSPENTQVTIVKEYGPNVFIKVNIDWFPVWYKMDGIDELCLIDLKLTKDINSKWGEFCWGDPIHMDHVQADLYWYSVMDIDFKLNDRLVPGNNLRKIITPEVKERLDNGVHKFLYWVYGYQVDDKDEDTPLSEQFLELERVPMQLRIQELEQRIDKAIGTLAMMEEEGWNVNPLNDLCSKCPVSTKYRFPDGSKGNGYCDSYPKRIMI